MSKRVHFSSTNRVYSPVPGTPSPSASTSSLPSSPDLPTPPPELDIDDPSQYPRSPYPHNLNFDHLFPEFEVDKEMHVHACLAYDPFSQPAVAHDLSVPIAHVREQYPLFSLQEPATQPPLQSLIVICPDFLPWDIHIKSSAVHPDAYVSVDDVVTTIYKELRLPVHHIEYQGLGPDKYAVDAAYFARLSRIENQQQRDQEASKGVKRVDFLRGRNRFLGLCVTPRGNDVWELNVS
ncbi:hypothetical protein DFP72DRAFT_49804 [Ephemerocybe angulata]|uniref:DUF6699 domain-containing protein n=1 Tax=Ephemerocybe angulata TaxID=980116 RepID=A0A8H6HG38_9AGAR|nr:hypothetical protein DFP72DRAFT_49804 [Tulosesus angulatus]